MVRRRRRGGAPASGLRAIHTMGTAA